MEGEIGMMWPQGKECQQSPEAGGGKTQIFPPGKSTVLPILDFKFLDSRTKKECIFVVLSHQPSSDLLQ